MPADALAWFRCFPTKLLGALHGMGPADALVYVTALLRIYENGGPVPETVRTLTRRTGLRDGQVREALRRLMADGRLTVATDGLLDSATTHAELAWKGDRRARAKAASEAAAEARNCDHGERMKGVKSKAVSEISQQKQRNDATERSPIEKENIDTSTGKAEALPSEASMKETPTVVGAKKNPAPDGPGRRRASRLDPDWQPSAELLAQCVELGVSQDEQLGYVLPEFRDYWCSRGGREAAKLDWPATYRNRCREVGRKRKFELTRNGDDGQDMAIRRSLGLFSDGAGDHR